jgi:hypothetical protein
MMVEIVDQEIEGELFSFQAMLRQWQSYARQWTVGL